MSIQPTILIGLGGIGSTIASKVYEQIPQENRKKVAIHVFDTDVNMINSLSHIQKYVTQTSSIKTPREYLAEDPSIQDWFPIDPTILDKPLTEGAGQLRVMSRLALLAAMKEEKLNAFWQEIEKIFPVTSDKTEYGVRVIIITSLAGGTGSGMFLQIALYLREMLRKKLRHNNIIIRGAFLLPDVLVKTRTISGKEFESVQANGYASLKELNAITLTSSGEHSKREGVTIQLEYRPDQVDVEGRNNHVISEKHLPYNYCFLYDYENLHGHHLLNLSDYMEQMTSTIYLQLFSPISANHLSQEDNQIQQLSDSNGKARYCGAGAAKLIYPYQNIVEYCSLKWAVQGLEDSWLHLDDLYEEKQTRYEKDVRKGIHREKLERGKSFVEDLEHLATRPERPHPFYKQIYLEAREGTDTGRYGTSKAKLFLEAVEHYVSATIQRDEELNKLQKACKISKAKLKITEQTKGEVARVDAAIKLYAYQIDTRAYDYVTTLAYDILDADQYAPAGSEGQSYQLNTWFLKKPHPVHPLTARYMLYEIKKLVQERISSLRQQNEYKRNLIKQYDKKFNVSHVEGNVGAVRRVETAQKQGFFSKLFKNELKVFQREFDEVIPQYVNKLNEYRKDLLLELVLSSLEQSIITMVGIWERFFDNLHETRENLLLEIDRRANEFEGRTNPTNIYVLATKEMQEQMWNSIYRSIDSGMLPRDISSEIYVSHYRKYCQGMDNKQSEPFKVEEFYRENVLAYCRKELQNRYHDKLGLSIIQALRKEASFKGEAVNSYVTRKIDELMPLSSPFIPKIMNHRELHYWGMHPESKKELNEQLVQELFEEKEIADTAFSPYELICYRAHYGLSIQDFPKFSAGQALNGFSDERGEYFQAYYRKINKLNRKKSNITPHLDKNWHLPAFMPDLNPNQAELDHSKCNRAFLVSLIYHWISLAKVDTEYVYQYNGVGSSSLIQSVGKYVRGDLHKLHQALLHNPFIYENIMERYEAEKEEALSRESHIYTHAFIQGAQDLMYLGKENINNILDAVMLYRSEGRRDNSLDAAGEELLKVLLEEIEGYFKKHFGPESELAAKREAAIYIEHLWNRCAAKQILDEASSRYKTCWHHIQSKLEALHPELVKKEV
ncbi:tubulin-like doman-containing protein [Bacillus sp. 165]|uniref:tubulin-like doman-containing protein n=1 Tax=Bacillus sp. 165 TaxID=1529117 RepID=UPI001ADD5990|nr:tubulin-like doman-containing protein [Bacillus sp. 165]MBO9129102.1 tubulin-like doman-containing protein [Bacillus sp. 165]